MGSRVFRYLLMSQISFFAFLAICLAIVPRFLLEHNEGGVSNYGVTAVTVVPFTLAFLTCAAFILMAVRIIPRHPPTLARFRWALFTLAILLLLVLVSTYPYKVDLALKDIHIVIGVLLLTYEMAMAFWLALAVARDWINILFLMVQTAGSVLALVTLVGVLHLLFVSQMIASAAFGVVLVRSGHLLVPRDGAGDRVPR